MTPFSPVVACALILCIGSARGDRDSFTQRIKGLLQYSEAFCTPKPTPSPGCAAERAGKGRWLPRQLWLPSVSRLGVDRSACSASISPLETARRDISRASRPALRLASHPWIRSGSHNSAGALHAGRQARKGHPGADDSCNHAPWPTLASPHSTRPSHRRARHLRGHLGWRFPTAHGLRQRHSER